MALLGQTVYTVTEKNDYHLQPQSFFKIMLGVVCSNNEWKTVQFKLSKVSQLFFNMSDCIQNEQHQLKITIVSMEFAM